MKLRMEQSKRDQEAKVGIFCLCVYTYESSLGLDGLKKALVSQGIQNGQSHSAHLIFLGPFSKYFKKLIDSSYVVSNAYSTSTKCLTL